MDEPTVGAFAATTTPVLALARRRDFEEWRLLTAASSFGDATGGCGIVLGVAAVD